MFYQGAGHRADALGLSVGVGDEEMCQMLQLETESSGRTENLQFQTEEMNNRPPLQKSYHLTNLPINRL